VLSRRGNCVNVSPRSCPKFILNNTCSFRFESESQSENMLMPVLMLAPKNTELTIVCSILKGKPTYTLCGHKTSKCEMAIYMYMVRVASESHLANHGILPFVFESCTRICYLSFCLRRYISDTKEELVILCCSCFCFGKHVLRKYQWEPHLATTTVLTQIAAQIIDPEHDETQVAEILCEQD
jgi:hypothetical protein